MIRLNNLVRYTFFLFIICSFSLNAQTRSELEKQRNNIISQIETAEKQLKIAEQKTSTTLEEYSAINAKIKSREKLIDNLKQQLELSKGTIKANQDSLIHMDGRFKKIKENYDKVMRIAHIKQRSNSLWLSIFSAKSLNEAILIWRYTDQFNAYLKRKKDEVAFLRESILQKNQSIKEESSYTDQLLQNENSQFDKLQKDKEQKNKLLKKYKSKTSELKSAREQKKKEREKLNQQIEATILAELSKAREVKKKKANNTTAKNSSNKRSSFARNNLNWPVSGGYISSKFGNQPHPTIPNVTITNNGVDIASSPASSVRVVADGSVVGITKMPGYNTMIIVEHGEHYTVYSKLSNAAVSKGQHLKANEVIGTLDENGTLHFELWKEKTKLDPEKWLKRK